MKLTGMARTALTGMQPQRSYQIAWFVYGWIEREHFLNVIACADWWMRAVGLSVAQPRPLRRVSGTLIRRSSHRCWFTTMIEPKTKRHGSSRQVEPLS